MNMLAIAFQDIEVNAAIVAQASASGAAIAIREAWNPSSLPKESISLIRFRPLPGLHFDR